MITRYSIIRYFPQVGSEEFINVGVVILGDNGETLLDWVDSYERVYGFTLNHNSPGELSFLNYVKESIETIIPALSLDKLEGYTKNMVNNIQWSEPRASTLPPRTLLQQLRVQYLHNEDVG